MIKTLTTVGNSKALIIPSGMIIKYNLDQVVIEETEEGLLIKSAVPNDSFLLKVSKLRSQKDQIAKRLKAQANHSETKKYYSREENNFSEVDVDITE